MRCIQRIVHCSAALLNQFGGTIPATVMGMEHDPWCLDPSEFP